LAKQGIEVQSLRMKHQSGSTRIVFGRGLLGDEKQIRRLLPEPARTFIVSNRKVWRIVGSGNFESIGKHFLPDSETAKSLSSYERLINGMIRSGLDRAGKIVAIGGGVCTDAAGFAAATYLRGVSWTAIPTTLVGQIDATIGGKTALDHAKGKNLIGAFWQPEIVLVDPEVLGTLPDREIRQGLAEMIKYGVIAEPELFDALEKSENPIADVRNGKLDRWILRAIQAKIGYVEADETDLGIRNHLNFGHTLAHAIEAQSEFKVGHGEAVALGMLFATNIARQKRLCSNDLFERIKSLITGMKLLPRRFEADRSSLTGFMARDKKRRKENIRFVLPTRIGRVVMREIPKGRLAEKAFWSFD
jgi:3-dehydroquinate synthase